MLKLTLDPDGDPTDECLESIEKEVITSSTEAIDMLDKLKVIWAYSNWGWKRIFDGNIVEYHISTTGWSGNESIMTALHNNIGFWKHCWEECKPGGHYIFKFKI